MPPPLRERFVNPPHLMIPPRVQNNTYGFTIHWIYVGQAPQGPDYSLMTTAPKQFERIYLNEKTCFWVMTDDVDFFRNIFAEQIQRGRFIVKEINFNELISSPLVELKISKIFQEIFGFAPASREIIYDFLASKLNWFFEVTKKISANNLVKELFLPLIMAYQASIETQAHYFDLSIFIDEDNPLILGEDILATLPKECVHSHWIEAKKNGYLPRWPHIKIPVKSNPATMRKIINAPEMSLDASSHSARLQTFEIQVQMLSMDFWWMYTPDDAISLEFYVKVFLSILRHFLGNFPDVRGVINGNVPIDSFFGPDKKLLWSIHHGVELNRYISNIIECTTLEPSSEHEPAPRRANLIAEPFFHSYNKVLAEFLSQNFFPEKLSIFSFCIEINSFSHLSIHLPNPSDEQKIILMKIKALNGNIENQFYRRFITNGTQNYWSPEVGYYKNMTGGWQILKQVTAISPREKTFLERYWNSMQMPASFFAPPKRGRKIT